MDGDKQSRQLLDAALAARGETVVPEGKVNAIDVVNTTSRSYPYALVVVPKELSTAGDVVKTSLTTDSAIAAQRLTTGELVFRACWAGYASRRYYITPGPASTAPFAGAVAERLRAYAVAQSVLARALPVSVPL